MIIDVMFELVKRYGKWLVVAMLMGGILSACSGYQERGPLRHLDRGFDYVAYKLDFTDEQELILDRIQSQTETILQETREQRNDEREQFIALIGARDLDVDQLNALMAKRHDRYDVFSDQLMPMVVELHATLSADQKEEIIERLNRWSNDK